MVKVGDVVTPENVASLPVGTVVGWKYDDDPETYTAKRVGDLWYPTGGGRDIPGAYLTEDPAAFVVSLGKSKTIRALTPEKP